MNTITTIIDFFERWIGTFPRVVLVFVGVLICVTVIGSLWERRMRLPGAIMGGVIGIGIVFNNQLLGYISEIPLGQRMRFLGVAISVAILSVTLLAVRSSSLNKKYGIFWFATGAGLLICSLRLESIRSLAALLEVQLFTLIGGGLLGLIFLLLFHFSLVLTRLEKENRVLQERLPNQGPFVVDTETRMLPNLRQRFSTLFGGTIRKIGSLLSLKRAGQAIRGTAVGAPLAILLASLAVLMIGLATPRAMVGDEVTHYYMLVKQAKDITQPNFSADIPMASGSIETRRYPHSFGWHYLGALVYLVTGGSFAGIQVYQTFFLLQFLTVAYLLARSRGGVETRAALLFVLTLASLPLCLLFSVTFYQDVPMSAQALTAFYLLMRRRWFLASCFMALAISFKVTAILFFPAFFFLVFFWEIKEKGVVKSVPVLICSVLVVLGTTWMLGKAINKYARAEFYPVRQLEMMAATMKAKFSELISDEHEQNIEKVPERKGLVAGSTGTVQKADPKPVVIANHPGDLRIKENYLIYGGLLFWLIIIGGAILTLPGLRKRFPSVSPSSNVWLYGVGGSFLLLTAYFIRTGPDARFFLPGLPFVILPAVEKLVCLPRSRMILILFASIALQQGAYVLNKTYQLRSISPEIIAGIQYLETHLPIPPKILMYPEGNYRYFPLKHEWYMGYRLRDFWRADNDKRIEMLHQFGVGAIVVKKHLIAPVDAGITNLGVYPPEFIRDLQGDSRFEREYDNAELTIYRVP